MPRPESSSSPEQASDQPQVAADRHAEPPVPDRQHFEGVDECQDHVGHDLADHQFPGADGRHDQLLDRAALALPHDRGGGQDGGDGEQDHADHTRDHEVGADQVGVVPDACAHFEGRLEPAGFMPDALQAFDHQLGGFRLADQRGRRQRGRCRQWHPSHPG